MPRFLRRRFASVCLGHSQPIENICASVPLRFAPLSPPYPLYAGGPFGPAACVMIAAVRLGMAGGGSSRGSRKSVTKAALLAPCRFSMPATDKAPATPNARNTLMTNAQDRRPLHRPSTKRRNAACSTNALSPAPHSHRRTTCISTAARVVCVLAGHRCRNAVVNCYIRPRSVQDSGDANKIPGYPFTSPRIRR
jgi:hypothetical protein